MRSINYLLPPALLLGGCGSVFGQDLPKLTPKQVREVTREAEQGDARLNPV